MGNENAVICPPCGEQSLAPEGFNPGVAVATKEGQNKKNALWPLLPRLTAVLPPQGREMTKGFTLIELLVVVLIIGILAAVAVPQYQKAVAKSRFATLKPLAKAVADAQEIYYYTHGDYGTLAELDVNATEEGSLSLSNTEGHNYVRASRGDSNNRYTLYFNHSENFAGNSYCEAEKDDSVAKAVCEAEQGQDTGLMQYGYKLYLISGSSTGSFPYKYVSGNIRNGATYFNGMDRYTFYYGVGVGGGYINVYKNGGYTGGWEVPNNDLDAYSFTNRICRTYPFLKECDE